MLVCISCAKNQQCALEFTISSGRTRKYSNEKGKRIGQSAAFLRFLLRFFLALLRWLHLAKQKERRRKKGGWVGISVVLFVLFVLHMLVGLGYCPFLDPITYDA